MAADALDVMMEFGLDDDVISGVLARTDMGSDQQPVYWALTGAYTDNGKSLSFWNGNIFPALEVSSVRDDDKASDHYQSHMPHHLFSSRF